MKPRAITTALAAALVAVLGLTTGASASTSQAPLTIFASASLTEVLRAFDSTPRYSFTNIGTIETQIRQGAPADIIASATPVNTQRLYRDGFVEKPVTFTANRLALIVPRSNPAGINSIYDLRRKDAKIVMTTQAAAAGNYTLVVLRKMGLSRSVLPKVVSREPDVKSVTGKIVLGQADAGFAFVTDARPISDQVRVIRIPAWAQPRIRYEVAVVSRSPNKAQAQQWIRGLLSPRGQAVLREAGFLPIPKQS